MEEYEVITRATYLLFIYLLVALFVERLIEILMAAYHYIDMRRGGYKYWNKKAHKWRRRLDRIYDYQGNQLRAKTLLDWLMWKILVHKPYPGCKSAISAKGVKFIYIRVGTRTASLVISLILVIFMHQSLGIDLLELLTQVGEDGNTNPDTAPQTLLSTEGMEEAVRSIPVAFRLIISAMVMAAGVEPLHELITRVEDLGKPKNSIDMPL